MAVLSDAELAKSIRQGELSPVYLLYGKETYQLQKHLSALIRKRSESKVPVLICSNLTAAV